MGFAGFIHHVPVPFTIDVLATHMQKLTGGTFRYAVSPTYPNTPDDLVAARQFAQSWIEQFQQQQHTPHVLVFLEANLAAHGSGMSFDDAFFQNHPKVAFVLFHNSPEKITAEEQARFLQAHQNIIAFDVFPKLTAGVLSAALTAARGGPRVNPAVGNAFGSGPNQPRSPTKKTEPLKAPGEEDDPALRTEPDDPHPVYDVLPERTVSLTDDSGAHQHPGTEPRERHGGGAPHLEQPGDHIDIEKRRPELRR